MTNIKKKKLALYFSMWMQVFLFGIFESRETIIYVLYYYYRKMMGWWWKDMANQENETRDATAIYIYILIHYLTKEENKKQISTYRPYSPK